MEPTDVSDASWPLPKELEREGITILGIPFGRLCVVAFEGDRERTLLRNIAYTGALTALLDIDMAVVDELAAAGIVIGAGWADVGSTSKRGEANEQALIDPVLLALSIGATFVARSFTGDKQQFVPILKAGIAHKGMALVDVISPCVTFNDHEGSTESYKFTREHEVEAVHADYVPVHTEITLPDADSGADPVRVVHMHDGSAVRLRTTAPDRPDERLRPCAGPPGACCSWTSGAATCTAC